MPVFDLKIFPGYFGAWALLDWDCIRLRSGHVRSTKGWEKKFVPDFIFNLIYCGQGQGVAFLFIRSEGIGFLNWNFDWAPSGLPPALMARERRQRQRGPRRGAEQRQKAGGMGRMDEMKCDSDSREFQI